MSDGTTQTATQTTDTRQTVDTGGQQTTTGATTQTTQQTGQTQATSGTTTQAAQATGTVLDTGGTTQTQQTNVGTWRDDWRVAMAGGDEKLGKQLDRYASPEAVAKALREAQIKISSGQLKQAKPDPKDEAAYKAWREENGIPESPDKYDLNLGNGLVLGDADKPMVDSFLKHVHGKDWTPSQVKEGLEWYHAFGEQQRETRTLKDAEFRKDAEDNLRAEWGQEYRINQNILKTSLEGSGMLDVMVGARGPDGRLLLANPAVIKWLVDEARHKNPVASVLGGSGAANIDTATNRLAELTKLMGDYNSDYWKGPKAAGLQEEYRKLTDAVEAVKARAA